MFSPTMLEGKREDGGLLSNVASRILVRLWPSSCVIRSLAYGPPSWDRGEMLVICRTCLVPGKISVSKTERT